MELRQLRYFLEILEAGSLSRAATSLYIAQPALSQQMQKLEAELGTPLLTRSARGVTPTDAGRRLALHARHILEQVEQAGHVARDAGSTIRGVVAVGLPRSIQQWLGLDLLQAARAQLPGVQLRLADGPSGWLTEQLAEGRLDLAMLFETRRTRGLALQAIFEEPLLLFGPPGTLRGRAPISPAAAAALPLILLSRPSDIRDQLDRLWERDNLQPRIVAEIDSPPLLLRAVQAGLGYAVLPASSLEDAETQEPVDTAALAAPGLVRTASLATSRLFPLAPAADAIRSLLLDLLQERLRLRAAHSARGPVPVLADPSPPNPSDTESRP